MAIDLPVAQAAVHSMESDSDDEPSPIVLIVDDEIQIRRFLRTGFELKWLRGA